MESLVEPRPSERVSFGDFGGQHLVPPVQQGQQLF